MNYDIKSECFVVKYGIKRNIKNERCMTIREIHQI